MNITIATAWIQQLIKTGVKDFCLCAGARNSPFVVLFDQLSDNPEFQDQFKIWNFFEERSAAFFALGKSNLNHAPVAIFTTSGTAVAELLPAVIEAYYTNKPLLLITADRPKVYRGKGAPQSIEQVGIYSHYCKTTIDIDLNNFESSEILSTFQNWNQNGPLHLNICFDEPLIDQVVTKELFKNFNFSKSNSSDFNIATKQKTEIKSHSSIEDSINKIKEFSAFLQKPIVVVSSLAECKKHLVKKVLLQLKAPLYLESTSGLMGDADLEGLRIKSGDKFVSLMMKRKQFDSVIRIGGVPTLRLWRDLEDQYKNVPVLSFSENDFSGLSRDSLHLDNLTLLESLNFSVAYDAELFGLDQKILKSKMILLAKYPLSEQSQIAKLSQLVGRDRIYLGNSLPIRHWDEYSLSNTESICANRGANGIDGQLSTFLGWSKIDYRNWCVVGDLTALYDLSSLWISQQMQSKQNFIVVINNKGGQIFKKMFGRDIFLNTHNIGFENWAKMWNWNYEHWQSVPAQESFQLSKNTIIEINPSPLETEAFNNEVEELWKKHS